jgi:hypothetical protein
MRSWVPTLKNRNDSTVEEAWRSQCQARLEGLLSCARSMLMCLEGGQSHNIPQTSVTEEFVALGGTLKDYISVNMLWENKLACVSKTRCKCISKERSSTLLFFFTLSPWHGQCYI